MPSIDAVRFQRSPLQPAQELKGAFAWGRFTRYVELGEDAFVVRQVDEYENGYLARYDRVHWEDQFGMLADFRFGALWRKHWGEPDVITRAEFESKWSVAATSPPFKLRGASPAGPPPWIALFESGKWRGQA